MFNVLYKFLAFGLPSTLSIVKNLVSIQHLTILTNLAYIIVCGKSPLSVLSSIWIPQHWDACIFVWTSVWMKSAISLTWCVSVCRLFGILLKIEFGSQEDAHSIIAFPCLVRVKPSLHVATWAAAFGMKHCAIDICICFNLCLDCSI